MKMKELFDRGEFVVSAEVGPPKGIHVDELVEEAKTYLKGVHAVNVTDNQSSVMRLGSLAMCKVLKDAGMDPIFQLACRDRNRIALESDLLSAAMLGIDNILCLSVILIKNSFTGRIKIFISVFFIIILRITRPKAVLVNCNPLLFKIAEYESAHSSVAQR